MVKHRDFPQSRAAEILNRAFRIENNFFDAGYGSVLPKRFRNISEQVKNLKVYDDDVFLCSFPRTGSTWMQEILWLLGNDLDFEKARSIPQLIRNPNLEISCYFGDDTDGAKWIKENMKGNSVDFVDQMEGRRFVKTHMPWHLLPEQLKTNSEAKIVYTMRNPKDQAVSFYHHYVLAHKIECSFEEFIEVFTQNKMVYGSSAQHMLEYYKRRNEPNVLVVKFEDMKRDLPAVIRQVADHLKIDRDLTNGDIAKLCDYAKFENMRENPSVNMEAIFYPDSMIQDDPETGKRGKFIRKGQVGDWKNYFTPEIDEKFDEWINTNMGDTGITFDYV